jgi:hypothetical protein
MWIAQLIKNRNVIKFDVEVLVDAFDDTSYGYVVFELHRYLVVDESLEKTARSVSQAATERG